jgi:hypothetical protein
LKTFPDKISIRLTQELLNKIEEITKTLQSSGYRNIVKISRQATIRMILQEGIDSLEKEINKTSQKDYNRFQAGLYIENPF